MATFTSSLPEELLRQLEEKASELSIPKNKLIERALTMYLDHLNRADYIRSYKHMSDDTDLITMAEEGMTDYLKQLAGTDDTTG
jgi:hypothetical protein